MIARLSSGTLVGSVVAERSQVRSEPWAAICRLREYIIDMTPSTLAGQPARILARALVLLAVSGGLHGASGQSATDGSSTAARDLFVPGRPIDVKVDLPVSSWDRLRHEGRSLPQVFAGCLAPDFAYTPVSARVSIDGESVDAVSVRKKGFLGSLSTERPSLRVDFGDDAHAGRTFHGTRRLTLNNNHQDPTNAKQCVVYELFTKAGLRAPRCGQARVTVNGADKGSFTNVEPVARPFLQRVFGDDTGNLYELTVGDFTPALKAGFELKTNERRNDRSDLDRVERALAAPDERFAEAFGQVFDLDAFMTFWAMEVLAGHWDGMTGNRNNTFIYHNPRDDRFHAIPWGTDGTFQAHPFQPNAPASVYASNTISTRLYAIPATRRLFHQRLRTLLDKVWNEDLIVNRLREITGQTNGNAGALAAAEAFVRGRRKAIETELASNDGRGPDAPTSKPFDPPACREPQRASGVIDFTWNDTPTAFQPIKDVAALKLQIPLPEGDVRFGPGMAAQLATKTPDGAAQIGIAGMDLTRSAPVFVGLIMPMASYKVGTTSFHGIETFGVVAKVGATGAGPLALIGGGTVTITEAGRQNGEPVRGTWEGYVVPLPIEPPRVP